MKLNDRINEGYFHIDSDVEDFSEEINEGYFHIDSDIDLEIQFLLKNTPCYGCRHSMTSGMYPCTTCSRAMKDFYEPVSNRIEENQGVIFN